MLGLAPFSRASSGCIGHGLLQSQCGFSLWRLLLVRSTGSRVSRLQELQHVGSAALPCGESSWIRDLTPDLCTGRRILKYWTTWEVPKSNTFQHWTPQFDRKRSNDLYFSCALFPIHQLILPALCYKYSQYPTISIHGHCFYLNSSLPTGHHAFSSSPIITSALKTVTRMMFSRPESDKPFFSWTEHTLRASLLCSKWTEVLTITHKTLPDLALNSLTSELSMALLSSSSGTAQAPCSSSVTSSQPLPQGLYKSCELCLNSSSPTYTWVLITSYRYLFRYHLTPETSSNDFCEMSSHSLLPYPS